MDKRLLEAAVSGNTTVLKHLVLHDPGVLLEKTPQGNTCLHISSIYGHLGFCTDVVALNRSLLSFVNADGETPLLCATTRGHATLASFFIKCCPDPKLTQAILKQDKEGCNALHHAIRNGHRELALELIAAEPALSAALNHHNESPMFIAVMRNYEDIFEKLLEIPDSAHAGTEGHNALHAAVYSGNSAIAKRIMETRPGLAKEEQNDQSSPVQLAVLWDKTDVLKVLLEHDPSLGYVYNSEGIPLLNSAAFRGHVGVARELLKHCPDPPHRMTNDSFTFLHNAVCSDKFDFLEFILDESQQHHMFKKLINMRDSSGKTALHYAVEKCNPRMVHALLRHKDIDLTVLDNDGCDPIWIRPTSSIHAKTLNWGEVSMLLLKYAPTWATHLYNHQKEVKDAVTTESREYQVTD